MNGVIYARYSSHNQREESIEQQIDECTRFAGREGISIVEIYTDEAVSGKTDKRNGFQRMLRDAEKHKFEVVIAYKSNRIARNMLNALQYEERLGKLGINTLYVKEEFGNNAAGRFAFRMMLNVNQFYSENLSEDIKRGMLDNAAQCKVNGALPLGYRKSSDGHYEIDPVGAAVVREIYDKYLADVPFCEIAADLNARGVRSVYGKPFNKSSFHKILSNKTYLGIYRFSGIEIPGGVPRIIDDAMFYEVQKRLGERRTHRRGDEFILSGKLFCGHCNSPMTGVSGHSKGKVFYYYTCRKRKTHECDKKPVPKDEIERRIVEAVRDYVLTDEVIEQVADLCVEYQKQTDIESERDDLRRTRDEAKRAINNILDALEKGIYTNSTQARLLELEQTVRDCENALAALDKAKIVDRDRVVFALNKFKAMAANNERYSRVLIQEFVKAVYLFDDDGGLRLDCYYGDGIKLYSPNGETAPPQVIRSKLSAFSVVFSCRI